MRYAEVIGDPIAQSKSPALHRFWLRQTGAQGDYRAELITPADLGHYLDRRRADQDWLGCNATIPHKELLLPLLDEVRPEAAMVGAVNCVVRAGDRLIGHNTDVDGIAAAIGHVAVERHDVVIIGAGGASRAMLAYLARRRPGRVTVLARDTLKAARLQSAAPDIDLHCVPLGAVHDVLATAGLIVNASPLGMFGSEPMPGELLSAVEANASGAALFDMVYNPLWTDFLKAGAAAGAETIDGLTMLIGQARRAFSLFFGLDAPDGDDAVRAVLTAPAPSAVPA